MEFWGQVLVFGSISIGLLGLVSSLRMSLLRHTTPRHWWTAALFIGLGYLYIPGCLMSLVPVLALYAMVSEDMLIGMLALSWALVTWTFTLLLFPVVLTDAIRRQSRFAMRIYNGWKQTLRDQGIDERFFPRSL